MSSSIRSIKWYISHFPEAMFPCVRTYFTQYVDYILNGYECARESNIVICGLARNLEKVLPYTIARVERLGEFFKNYHVFIFENDSTDSTKSILTAWTRSNIHITVSCNNYGRQQHGSNCTLERTVDMAFYRNQYLSFVKQWLRNHVCDYVCVIDCDLYGGWSYEGVLNTLGHPSWDVVTANGLYYRQTDGKSERLYMDAWAYREVGHEQAHEQPPINRLRFERGEPLHHIWSGFGGMAWYKADIITDDIEYKAGDCDHPTLHKQLRDKCCDRIYVNPSLITIYNPTDYVKVVA